MGAADSTTNATVTLSNSPTLAAGPSADGGGYFDERSDVRKIELAVRDFGDGLANLERDPVLAASAGLSTLGLVAAIRSGGG
jgi:hypothetical protein